MRLWHETLFICIRVHLISRNFLLIHYTQVYDTTNDTWTTMGSLPAELLTSDHAAFAIDNMLYVVGGYNDRYEATRQTPKAPMPTGTSFLAPAFPMISGFASLPRLHPPTTTKFSSLAVPPTEIPPLMHHKRSSSTAVVFKLAMDWH